MNPFLVEQEDDWAVAGGKDGYSLDRFAEHPSEDYICVLCTGVVRSPLECMNCGLLLCRKCVGDYLKSRRQRSPGRDEFSCPQCRFKASPRCPSKLLLTIISELPVHCKYQAAGCEVLLPLHASKAHHKECPHRAIKCAYCAKIGSSGEFREVGKEFACSQECERTWKFREMVRGRRREEAVRLYYELLLEKNEAKKQ